MVVPLAGLRISAQAPQRARVDNTLIEALARADRWRRILDDGRYGSVSELAAAEKLDRGYPAPILMLTLLAAAAAAPRQFERAESARNSSCSSSLSSNPAMPAYTNFRLVPPVPSELMAKWPARPGSLKPSVNEPPPTWCTVRVVPR